MASYQLFVTDLRLGSLNYNESTQHYWAPVNADAVLLDSAGYLVPPTGLDESTAYITMWSTEPVEYGDDIDDLKRKVEGCIETLWQMIETTDTVTITYAG